MGPVGTPTYGELSGYTDFVLRLSRSEARKVGIDGFCLKEHLFEDPHHYHNNNRIYKHFISPICAITIPALS